MRSFDRAPRLTLTKGPARRGPCVWSARATSSLPVPVSPRTSTGTWRSATRSTSSRTRTMPSLSPTMPSAVRSAGDPSAPAARGVARCSSSATRPASTSGTPDASASAGNSRPPFTGSLPTTTGVPSSGTSSRTPPRTPGSKRTGVRLRNGSPRGSDSTPPGRLKSGALRDSATARSPDRSPSSSRRSPMRCGCAWPMRVSAGTAWAACEGVACERTAVVENSAGFLGGDMDLRRSLQRAGWPWSGQASPSRCEAARGGAFPRGLPGTIPPAARTPSTCEVGECRAPGPPRE
ncbi:hypothetical protein COSO111634_36405 [Corallococcus soli]